MEEIVGLEGVVAEDEHPGAGCTSKPARAARDLERGLDCVVRIVVTEVEHARRGMAAYAYIKYCQKTREILLSLKSSRVFWQ